MNELNREVVLNDLLNALKAQGEIRSTEKDYETDEDYVEVDGQIYTFFITIEITERPYISYYRSATYWPVDQASPAESETSGKFRFYITKITCFNEDGDEYNLSDILTPEDINTIEANMDFDEDEFTDGVDDLYESKKIRLSEQDITYMVKRVLKEAYNNKKKAQHTMNESRIIKINENMIKQIVETCVKRLLKENDMDEFRGGTIVYHEKNHMGTTGGKIQDIFPYNEYLIFQWQEDRGLAIKNDRETLQALRYGYPKCPEATLVDLEGGGVRPIETGGFAVYKSSLHWDNEKGGYVYENKLNEELDFKKEQEIANKMVSCLSPEERMYLLEKLNDNSYQDFLYTLMNAVDNNGNWFNIP